MRRTTVSIPEDITFTILVDNVNDKVIAHSLLEDNIWEPTETNIVCRLLSEGLNVIDVGANIGYYSILFSKIVGDQGRVFSFEPEHQNYAILCSNVLLNHIENIVHENMALSDRAGGGDLYLSEHNKGDHRLAFEAGRQHCLVDLQTLDNYLSDFEGEIHFIKSDTQGHELKVLGGMKQVIQKNIDHLCCLIEFSPGLLQCMDDDGLESFLDFFDAYQAEIYWIKEESEKPELVLVDQELLLNIGLAILKYREEDFSKDLLIFFNAKARSRYFKAMGLVE